MGAVAREAIILEQLSSGAFFREAIILGVIIQEEIVWGTTIQGTNFHGGNRLDTLYDIYSDYKSFRFV